MLVAAALATNSSGILNAAVDVVVPDRPMISKTTVVVFSGASARSMLATNDDGAAPVSAGTGWSGRGSVALAGHRGRKQWRLR